MSQLPPDVEPGWRPHPPGEWTASGGNGPQRVGVLGRCSPSRGHADRGGDQRRAWTRLSCNGSSTALLGRSHPLPHMPQRVGLTRLRLRRLRQLLSPPRLVRGPPNYPERRRGAVGFPVPRGLRPRPGSHAAVPVPPARAHAAGGPGRRLTHPSGPGARHRGPRDAAHHRYRPRPRRTSSDTPAVEASSSPCSPRVVGQDASPAGSVPPVRGPCTCLSRACETQRRRE